MASQDWAKPQASKLWSARRRHSRRAETGLEDWACWVIPISLLLAAGFYFVLYLVNARAANIQCAVALAITAAPFLVAAVDAPGRLLHPLAIFGFTMVLGVAGQTIYLTHGASLRSELLSGLSPEILSRGLLVVSIGVIALCAGYLVSRPVGDEPQTGRAFGWAMRRGFADPAPRRVFWLCLGLLAISAVAFALYAPKVGIHGLGDLLSSRKRFAVVEGKVVVYGYYRSLIGLCGVGFLLAVYTIFRDGLRWRSGLGTVAILSILATAGFAVVTSSRTELFGTVTVAAFIALALRQREPRLGVIVAVILAALASITLLVGLRSVSSGQSGSLDTTTRLDSVLENAVGSRDWMDIGPIAVVVDRVPETYPFQYGKTLASILWEPIPRTIWKGKPAVRIGPTIGPPVFGFHPSERVSGDPPGILGEFWIDGGWVGVALGMFILGVAIKQIERWYAMVGSTAGLSALLFGVVGIATCLQLPIADFTGILTIALENLVILAVLLWLARKRSSTAPDSFEAVPSSP